MAAKQIPIEELMEKLQTCESAEQANKLLKANGIDVPFEELTKRMQKPIGELTDDDLEDVAGGVGQYGGAMENRCRLNILNLMRNKS